MTEPMARPDPDPYHRDLGCYHAGAFYSESSSGVPYETDLILPTGVGRTDDPVSATPGGGEKTQRLLTLLHGTAHLVHDLSLGVAMETDLLRDESWAVLVSLLHDLTGQSTLRCPLLAPEHHAQWSGDAETRRAVEFVQDRQATIHLLLHDPYHVLLPEGVSAFTGEEVMEGLVTTKTATALALRATEPEDVTYLQAARSTLPILPETLPAKYYVARQVYDALLGPPFLQGLHGVDYLCDDWPQDYPRSLRALVDAGYTILADIALHIPPLEVVSERVENGENTWEDFIPTRRFHAAIQTCRSIGFPDDHPGIDFYRLVFDTVAERRNWPSLTATNEAWQAKLALYKEQRGGSSDGFRFRLLTDRELRPKDVALGDALAACWRQHIPVFHLTPTGLKVLQAMALGDRTMQTPFELSASPVYELFHWKVKAWQDLPAQASIEDVMSIDQENVKRFLQETVYRALAWELQDAVLHRGSMACPFVRRGCPAATPDCGAIRNLGSIPKHECALRDYLAGRGIDGANLVWPDNN